MAELFFKEEVYRIVGACFEVYKDKGHGFVESVYQDCLEIELELQKMPFDRKRVLTLEYKGRTLDHWFAPDLICYEQIIVEIKAVKELADEHRAQLQPVEERTLAPQEQSFILRNAQLRARTPRGTLVFVVAIALCLARANLFAVESIARNRVAVDPTFDRAVLELHFDREKLALPLPLQRQHRAFG